MCRSGCKSKDCGTYANCLRNARPRVAYCNSAGGWDATKQQKWDAELQAFRDAKAEGLDPVGTTMDKIDAAKRIADVTGRADVPGNGYVLDSD